jgi:ferredoxin-NADP reductase
MESGREGATEPSEFYPALMELGELSSESRREAERLARERMSAGVALMSSGLARLESASTPEDFTRMHEALAQTRQGIEQLESGTTVLHALAAGSSPREISLNWFRRSMSLPSADVGRPHGLFGLSAFHYFTMLLLAAALAAMIWLSWQKMRRSRALVARLVGGRNGASLPMQPIAIRAQGPPDSIASGDVPSKPNSWSGLLRVARLFEESPDVRTLRLANPDGSELPFRHLPGQFVTFTVRPIDQPVKRSYTIASPPTRRDYLEVTVKREGHGTVSSFLHGVHEGDTLQVTGPSGSFTFVGEGANSIVLISGGVGVTPMMSVLRYLTDRSWSGDIFFIYGCRSDRDVIYREELEYLQRRHPNLKLVIVANEAGVGWPHARGLITAELIASTVPHVQTRRIHLCGPTAMMSALRTALTELGVPTEQVKTEVFIGRERSAAAPIARDSNIIQGGPSAPSAANVDATATPGVSVLTFARSRQTALLPPDKTVLEASEDVGVNIEYSCRIGVCGLCKVKLLSGAVTMEVQDSLDANDRKKNIILACQAKSSGDLSVDA